MKNKLSKLLILLSIIFSTMALIFQNRLDIFSFLLVFYLIPLLIYSIGIGILSLNVSGIYLRAFIGAIVFTLIYSLVYSMGIVNFEILINNTRISDVDIGSIEMDLSSIMSTFSMVFILTIISNFFKNRFTIISERR